MPWYQIPQHTLRGLGESMLQGVRAIFMDQRDWHNIMHVVLMLWLVGVLYKHLFNGNGFEIKVRLKCNLDF